MYTLCSFNKLIKRCNFSIKEIGGPSTPTKGMKLEGKGKLIVFLRSRFRKLEYIMSKIPRDKEFIGYPAFRRLLVLSTATTSTVASRVLKLVTIS